MKKFVFGIFMMVAFMVSCTKTEVPTPSATTQNDTTVVDTTVVDTTVAVDAPDSAAIVEEKVTE